jgi:hypothetical protein
MARQYSNPPDRGCSWSVSSERPMMDHMPWCRCAWVRVGIGTADVLVQEVLPRN